MSFSATTRAHLPKALRREAEAAAAWSRNGGIGLAVTLVEQFHRPWAWRMLEYAVWSLARATGHRLQHQLTLGRCQMRAEYLMAYLSAVESSQGVAKVLATGEHVGRSAAVVEWYLRSRGRAESVSKTYTGRHNPYYEQLVSDVLFIIDRTARRDERGLVR